jgi:hypothetical protein
VARPPRGRVAQRQDAPPSASTHQENTRIHAYRSREAAMGRAIAHGVARPAPTNPSQSTRGTRWDAKQPASHCHNGVRAKRRFVLASAAAPVGREFRDGLSGTLTPSAVSARTPFPPVRLCRDLAAADFPTNGSPEVASRTGGPFADGIQALGGENVRGFGRTARALSHPSIPATFAAIRAVYHAHRRIVRRPPPLVCPPCQPARRADCLSSICDGFRRCRAGWRWSGGRCCSRNGLSRTALG